MNNNMPIGGSLLARFFLPLRAALDLWRRSRCAAFAAGRTYENARGAGAPHDAAAEAAFEALTKEERPGLPEVAPGAHAVPAAPDASSSVIGRPGWPAAQGSC
jgi:hypothetical protein